VNLARLLAAALVICSLPAWTQDQPKPGYMLRSIYSFGPCFAPAATPEKPWEIIPNRPADLASGQTLPSKLSLDRPGVECRRYVSLNVKGAPMPGNSRSCSHLPDADATCHIVRFYLMSKLPNGQPAYMDIPVNESEVLGPTCYTTRGYVVARDSQDSGSTRPTVYSTCEPAEPYRVRTMGALEGPIVKDNWSHYNVATASEPWKILPDSPRTLVSGQTRLDQIPADQLQLEVPVRQLLESQLDRLREEGPTCYAIRSYVVARDSKDSDSTHPAGYSTCQPATRYGVKTTEIRSATADR
jgi:hypothetical protein